jgi:hypothetical protein
MDQIGKGLQISGSRRLLMETLAGHIALLQATYPRKAASRVTKRAKQCVMLSLKQPARSKAA